VPGPHTALSALAVVPFALMLLAIALLPVAAPRWWKPDRNKLLLSAVAGLPVFLLYLRRDPTALLEAGEEYLSFILLLSVLYVIAGGIRLHGDVRPSALHNTAFLAAGALLASFVGTTGSAIALIRPLLQANRERSRVTHTAVFFIFLAGNVGGLLTPLGDPPLYLGYLEGVPFTWTLRLWPPWLFMVASLLLIYYAWDRLACAREPAGAPRPPAEAEPLRLEGTLNLLWLGGVLVALGVLRAPAREIAISLLAGLSLWLTPGGVRRANAFTAHPIIEVAAVFLGIFVTMIPALELLRAHAPRLGIHEPWHFFWATGILSSLLDNAPTYLTFLALARGLGLPAEVAGAPEAILAAISLGAVFMGALTYIGNAPNFMIRAIAEDAGVPMPSFFGYLAYSLAVLVPLFAAVSWLFL